MAEKSGSSVTENWPKWQIALAVGAPVALGVAGLLYYRYQYHPSDQKPKDQPEKDDDTKKTAQPTSSSAAQPSGTAEQTPHERAQLAKNKGNKYFKGGKYDKAIECYTEAITICPTEHKQDIATFYQNRAAAFEQLKRYDKVIADCSKALEHNNKYVKALFRRAKAEENTSELMSCLEDITAVCILEGFQNQQSLLMADRVLKELGKTKAKEEYPNRQPVIPSPQFILNYFSAFVNDPFVASLGETESEGERESTDAVSPTGSEPEKHQEEPTEKEITASSPGSSPYLKARESYRKQRYSLVVDHCTQELEKVGSSSPHYPQALLLRGTFYLLRGEGHRAMEDLDQLLKLKDVDKRIRSNALIKRGSLKMQNGEQTEALNDFAVAAKEDPENSDIYHHRGQLHLLIEQVDDAVKDFKTSVTLSPDFAIAHVQKCYAEYRQAFNKQSSSEVQAAIKTFEDTIDKYPKCAEGYALYGQALCDQQMFEKADANFKRAIDIEPEGANVYVHRGLLRLQWKQDIAEAASLIAKALEVDDTSEFAYETLGTIEVQRGNLEHAIELFNKAIRLSKTEVEMAHLYSLLDAAIAQSRVAANFGIQVPNMGMM